MSDSENVPMGGVEGTVSDFDCCKDGKCDGLIDQSVVPPRFIEGVPEIGPVQVVIDEAIQKWDAAVEGYSFRHNILPPFEASNT